MNITASFMSRNPVHGMCGVRRDAVDPAVLAGVARLHPLLESVTVPFQVYSTGHPQFSLVLAGEVDVAARPLLAAALCHVDLPLVGDEVVIDARRLSYIDHHGLLELATRLRRQGTTGVLFTAAPGNPNPAYADPVRALTEPRTRWHDPLERQHAQAHLTDPSPGDARAAVAAVAGAAQLDPTDLGGLQVAVSEAVANALLYGAAPVDVRIWAAPGRIAATVRDAGAGPSDPFAGLLPVAEGADGGRGLWLMHQLCAYVGLQRNAAGFTVRLVGGEAWPRS